MKTADIGILIRDRLEGDVAYEHDWESSPVNTLDKHEITFVDVSDPDNPMVHVSNGQKFRIIIIASY